MSKKRVRRVAAEGVRHGVAPLDSAVISPSEARKLMKRAIAAMRNSVAEPRSDGKPSPRVGGVLRLPSGEVIDAYRGELRHGDHAEFTLLERKCLDRRLDGSALFATLEPCAPEARRRPKLGCAERIVLARIHEVRVGIEDPHPSVDRKGIKYLQDAGVTVHMFDRDLQSQIREANVDFLRNSESLRREAHAAQRGTPPVLSSLEAAVPSVTMSELRKAPLRRYCERLGIGRNEASPEFLAALRAQGLVAMSDGQLVPTGFGVVLFGERPRDTFPHAGVHATVHRPDGTESSRSFDGPLVEMPKYVTDWLERVLPEVLDRSRVERSERAAVPLEILREAVVNALVHRDYGIAGAKVQVVVTPDAVLIRSPGAPVPPITLSQLASFDAPMLSRNPKLHFVFRRMGLAEEVGLGMNTLRSVQKKYHLPAPRYSYTAPYLDLTIFRSADSAARGLARDRLGSLRTDERRGWTLVVERGSVAPREYATEIGVDVRTALRHLRRFVELGLLERRGAGRSTRYEISR